MAIDHTARTAGAYTEDTVDHQKLHVDGMQTGTRVQAGTYQSAVAEELLKNRRSTSNLLEGW